MPAISVARWEFESEETRFIFNAQRKIDRIVPLVRNDAHKIIEECMIQAANGWLPPATSRRTKPQPCSGCTTVRVRSG